MNNYHVYGAIGRGKHSTVYKGRMKKSIEYFAIKSVDKSQRSKVLHEVKMLHDLDHPNILKFYSWYESSAHLWLILEYCVGRDLMSLLKEDGRLPEESVHDLAHDIVKALQFLHSKGIIYCDLKPSNILLDENGHIKLCDFGLATRLSEIEKKSLATMLISKRGTPCYMAPELFKDGGVNSYASDFWALGCVLYECYAGKPPFIGNEFTKLAKSILLDSTPVLPNNPSEAFGDLVNSLLIKDPAERLTWPELCQHRFWRTKLTCVSLPPQLAFSKMLNLSVKYCLAERNGGRPSLQRTPTKGRESNTNDENSSKRKKVLDTPPKSANLTRKIHAKAAEAANDDKRKAVQNTGKDVNLLRLSRLAKLNIQRENEKENYRISLHRECENIAEVKIDNNDMELDFSEIPEDDQTDETDASENPPKSLGEKLPIQNSTSEIGVTEHDICQPDATSRDNCVMLEGLKKLGKDTHSEKNEIVATPPSVYLQRKGNHSKTTLGNSPDAESSRIFSDIFEVFWHPTDLSVKPVMPSRKGSKTSDAIPSLPFEVVPASEYVKLLPEQLNTLNNQMARALSGSPQNSEKVIKYLEILSVNSDAANLIVNGSVMVSLIKMLRHPKSSILRVQIVSVIGLFIRHSTNIGLDLASSGIIDALAHCLRDKQDKVRRFSMAALGELLFYISTLNNAVEKDNCATESPSRDKRCLSGWQVSSSLIGLVSSMLRKGEDDAVQLYALKTIDNMCSQGEEWTSRFASHDAIGNLSYIYKATSKQETTRLIAGSCLVRLAHFSPLSIQSIFEKLSVKDTASSVIKSTQAREKQICLTLLNMAILSGHLLSSMLRHLSSLMDELVPGLIALIEQGNEVLRGKALVFVSLLCKNSRRWFPQFLCNAKLLSIADRLVKEKDTFLQLCMETFVQLVSSTVPEILETVSGDIQHMMGGKRHGFAVTARNNTKSTYDLFPAVLNLLGSSSFKHRVVSSHFLIQLASLLKLLESPFQGRDDFQITLLRILEAVTEEPSAILDDPQFFTGRVLPGLATLYKGNRDGDARFLCLKILFDVVMVILSHTTDSLNDDDGKVHKALKVISDEHFLPLYPNFIEDEDPIPMYAQKLLVMLIEYKYIKISDILHLETVSKCFEFLLNDLSHANVNNVKLCLALASAPEMETRILSHLGVVRRIGNLLEFVNANGMEDFLGPTLGLCKAFLLRSIGTNKGVIICKEPALLGRTAFDTDLDADQQCCVEDISDFGCHITALLELIRNSDALISDLASECVVLLLRAAPREATVGLLANLSKISVLLECLNEEASTTKLVRLLYALGFACKHYLSQAMILSISMPDVVRIEVLLSVLKNSRVPSLSVAALNLGKEMQGLPRCV
ncbi:Mitogen-activated protein kinase kinase kinase 2 [Platanthera zijinensis]|uniref:Mitogen-activated protein kinase kinase kinase 2 n=1 Tax=Platanthera zijinensis TaxID=2320716 RepID=A0AAP0B3R7_9ASPA